MIVKIAIISGNDYANAGKGVALLINGSMWHPNLSDVNTDGVISSNNTLLIFNNLNSLQHSNIIHRSTHATVSPIKKTRYSKGKTLKQFNELYICHIGNKTISLSIFPHFIIVGAQKAGTTDISKI